MSCNIQICQMCWFKQFYAFPPGKFLVVVILFVARQNSFTADFVFCWAWRGHWWQHTKLWLLSSYYTSQILPNIPALHLLLTALSLLTWSKTWVGILSTSAEASADSSIIMIAYTSLELMNKCVFMSITKGTGHREFVTFLSLYICFMKKQKNGLKQFWNERSLGFFYKNIWKKYKRFVSGMGTGRRRS